MDDQYANTVPERSPIYQAATNLANATSRLYQVRDEYRQVSEALQEAEQRFAATLTDLMTLTKEVEQGRLLGADLPQGYGYPTNDPGPQVKAQYRDWYDEPRRRS